MKPGEPKEITKEQFDEFAKRTGGHASYGHNQIILTEAEKGKYVEMEFENDRRAQSKQTALYVARRKLNAQVAIVRKGNKICLGPGKYMPSTRGGKKK
jgi:hypothetical protein